MTLRLAAAAVVALAAVAATAALPLARARPPAFASVHDSYCPSDARLLDRHGAVLQEQRVDATRRRLAWTPLGAVSPALVDALLRSEDHRFFDHDGVDWRAVLAAAWQRARGGALRGASTVSMQVASLLDADLRRGGAARSLADKWRQMRAAWALERSWSKQEILEAYLNLVTFRGELQGIGAAAQVLFDKQPHGLTTAESRALAALVRAPNADRATLARRIAAAPGEDVSAVLERIYAAPVAGGSRLALAPHAARRLMQPGASPCVDTRSTLDGETQRYAAASLRRQLLAIRDRWARDAAVLVVDNASGDVLAYVAGSGDLSSARHVDGIQAHRQAGSTLKPFLYARALDRRLLTAASLLDDTPLELAVGPGLFRPRNYDEQFRGLVSLRIALAGSLNVPAVRTLMLVGPDDFAAQLRALGFVSVAQPGDYYGPALALGAADITLWELVNAYRTLANGGMWSALHLAVHSPASADRATPMSPAAAFVVSDILADRDSRSVTFGLESPLATRFWSAVKTGTSKDMRDNWCVGYSRRYTVGVWVGNFSGEPMRDVSGMSGAAPIWADVINWLHRDLPSDTPPVPLGIRRAAAQFADGVEAARSEWYLAGTEPTAATSVRAQTPRIVAPTDGSRIAVDPDIPAARQRVAFEAANGARARWMLDGVQIGAADSLLLWPPTRGDHTLELVDAGAHTIATVRFEVHGSL